MEKSRDPIAEAIAAAKAKGPMTDAERASFARGEIGMGSDRDEVEYRAAARGDRSAMARMDQEAEDRVKGAFR
jgi:hypothetical protein